MLHEKISNSLPKIGKGFLGLLLIAIGSVLNAFTFMKLWNWFIAPLSLIMPLSLLWAYGIMLTVSIFTWKSTLKQDNALVVKDAHDDVQVFATVLNGFIAQCGASAVALGLGCLIHLWM